MALELQTLLELCNRDSALFGQLHNSFWRPSTALVLRYGIFHPPRCAAAHVYWIAALITSLGASKPVQILNWINPCSSSASSPFAVAHPSWP
jgi:hypothetical protein